VTIRTDLGPLGQPETSIALNPVEAYPGLSRPATT